MDAIVQSAPTRRTRSKIRHLIDCDVHVYPQAPEELREYLPEPWRSRDMFWALKTRGAFKSPGGSRSDSKPPTSGPPGSDPDFLWKQVFERDRVEVHYAILIELLGGVQHDPRFNVAYRSAINSWTADTWLGKYNSHGRYKGSITVPPNDPHAAAAEIEKWAGHPHFVQVQVPPFGVAEPYGHRQYDPIWKAASRHNLPVAIHVNEPGINPWITPVGHARYWSEYHAVMYPLTYAAQFVSLLCDGAFERFDNLRFVFVEGGFQWSSAIIERLVASEGLLSKELGRKWPSREFIADHVRFSSQPVEDVPNRSTLIESMRLCNVEKTLMYSSDYPHWDADDPLRAFPQLPVEWEKNIYYKNASDLYGLRMELPSDA